MFELPCYDLDGNLITHFTQWDMNQVIFFEGNFSSIPYVDFWNDNQDDALRVSSVVNENGQFQVEIPNILLLESRTLMMYIYVQDNINNPGKTIYTNSIPVRPRAKPNDFEYADNVHVVSVIALEEKLKELIEELNVSIANCEAATQAAYDAINNI